MTFNQIQVTLDGVKQAVTFDVQPESGDARWREAAGSSQLRIGVAALVARHSRGTACWYQLASAGLLACQVVFNNKRIQLAIGRNKSRADMGVAGLDEAV